ncbi:MAG: amidohydrolase family protein [Steroidobacteraceae bacterium]
MVKFRLLLSISALCAANILSAQVLPVPAPAPPAGPVVILTGNALDGTGGTLRNARIGVADGHITTLNAAPGGAVIDLRGYTVLPGWIDTHVHLDSHFDHSGRIATETEPPLEAALGIAGAAWDTLMGGFTTVQTVGDPTEKPLRDAIRERGFPGPRVLTSLAWIEGDSKTTREELIAAVRLRKSQGADLIKIFASSSQRVGATPTFTEEQLRILCDEARAVGLRSMVHAYRSQVAAAARAGCREIEHATYATQTDIDAAVAAGAFISPQVGLVVQNYLANKARYLGVGNYTEAGMATMDHDMHFDFEVCTMAVHTPNAKVVFSTDATAGAHGRNAEEFLGRVEHCGQTPLAALVSANAVAAEAIGMADQLGRLAPGYAADIIALDGDPLKDLTAVRRVVFVMRGGVVYKWAGAASVKR